MAKKRVDLLVTNSNETVTLESHNNASEIGIIDNGAVAIDHGKIVRAASTQLIEKKFQGKKIIDVEDEIVLPGLVDPHTHLVFAGGREAEFQLRVEGASYLDTLRKGGGIIETAHRTQQASPEALFREGIARLNTCLESGSTTVEIKSGYGLREDDEIKILEVIEHMKREHPCNIVSTFMGAHAIPPGSTSSEYLKILTKRTLPRVSQSRLAKFCDVFCEQGAFSSKESATVLRQARRLGLDVKIHADQFSESGGAMIANTLHATSADHLVHSSTGELETMTKTGVTPVLLPSSSYGQLTHDNADARGMLALGLPVALGTDFSPSNWMLGQLPVAAFAARELRMKASEIIRGITINAARALGLDGWIGSLLHGKRADLVTLRMPNHKWIGYSYGEGAVDNVLIAGEHVVRNGKRMS